MNELKAERAVCYPLHSEYDAFFIHKVGKVQQKLSASILNLTSEANTVCLRRTSKILPSCSKFLWPCYPKLNSEKSFSKLVQNNSSMRPLISIICQTSSNLKRSKKRDKNSWQHGLAFFHLAIEWNWNCFPFLTYFSWLIRKKRREEKEEIFFVSIRENEGKKLKRKNDSITRQISLNKQFVLPCHVQSMYPETRWRRARRLKARLKKTQIDHVWLRDDA